MFLSKNDYFRKKCCRFWGLICEALCFSPVLLGWAGLFCPEFAPLILHVSIYLDSAFELSWCAVPSSLTLWALLGVWLDLGGWRSQSFAVFSACWGTILQLGWGTHHVLELSRILAFPPSFLAVSCLLSCAPEERVLREEVAAPPQAEWNGYN